MILFGSGNAPQRPELTDALRAAYDRGGGGVVIVAISQCTRGAVSDAYNAGQTLLQAGIVWGGGTTPEVNDPHQTYFKGAESVAVCAPIIRHIPS